MAKKKTAKRGRGRPSTGITPNRYFRMADEEWQRIKVAAELEGITTSAFIRETMLRAADRVMKKHQRDGEG